MTTAEVIRVLLFLAFLSAVYVSAIKSIVDYARGNYKGGWKKRIVLSLAGIGLACMAYGYFVEPYWLSVARISITSPKLPKGMRPIRIAHISDVHSDSKPRLEERLSDVIALEKPDLIVFTGDSINSPEGLPVFKALLTRLSRIAPTFAVKGNGDTSYWSKLDLFGDTGVRELDGAAVKVDVRGTPLWLVGIASGANITRLGHRRLGELLTSVSPRAFTILLYHNPDFVELAARLRVDLYCAGHTHGGQVALPLYGTLITGSFFGKNYESGLYHLRETYLYVNRGIGMSGGYAPRIRFWARPELTLIEVAPEK